MDESQELVLPNTYEEGQQIKTQIFHLLNTLNREHDARDPLDCGPLSHLRTAYREIASWLADVELHSIRVKGQ